MICDFAKIAINTSIYTGKIVGVNSHIFGDVVSNIPSFINLTKSIKGKNEEFRLEEAIKIQKRMFERRDVKQTDEDIKNLEFAFEDTKQKREVFLNN